MTGADLVLVGYDRTDTQGVADSVVKYLRRDHGYEVVVVGPGQGRELATLAPAERARARFFLELDAISGVLHHTEGLEGLRCPKLAWLVDSHKKPHLHQRIAPEFDVVFYTMAAWGGLFGERGRWLPVHFDEEWFVARPDVRPDVDVGFVGSQPRERTRALQAIAARHGLSLLLETTTGPREKQRTAELYARCKVVFNRHVANDLNFRMVEGPACRRLLLTDAQRNGQYELFRDREHVVYYKDDEDLEAALLHYLRHDAERERIAAAGHALVHRLHTTAARVRELVAAAEDLVAARGGPARRAVAEPERAVAEPERVGAEPGREAAPRLVLSPPSRPLQVLVLAGDGPDGGPDARALALAGLLAGPGVAVTLLALTPPTCAPPDVRAVAAPGPRLPALGGAPRVRALLENVPLLEGARATVRATAEGDGDGPAVLVAARAEHALAAVAAGRPGVVVVDDLEALAPEDLVELARARAVWVAGPAARDALATRAPALAPRLVPAGLDDLGAPARRELLVASLREAAGAAPDAARPPAAPRPRAADVRYDAEYMRRYGYSVRSPEERRLKAVQAAVITRVLAPRRALVAGCAAGELLLPLLERGVDAWGFDAAEGLEAFVYPEVRERVLSHDVARVGELPPERTGGPFDTFVAIDLFEHVDEDQVERMLDGVAARFERLALVISSSPAFEGHVCVKPFPWWLERLEARGFELLAEPATLAPDEVGAYGVKPFVGVREDMSEQLVFLRRRARVDLSVVPAPAKQAPGERRRAPDERGRPDVSVGVVCCDRPDVLEVTLASTRASLVGSLLDVEWLAYDNGSGPAVRRVLEDAALDAVLRAARNRGLAPALDALCREARGRYLLTLEDDWECLAATHGWLDLAVAILDTQPDVGLVRLRRADDGQCGHFKRHRREVALRHHPWSVEPFPAEVVETREVDGARFYVAGAPWVNWTHNPTLCRREVRDWLGPLVAYLPDPRDHRPRDGHPGLEGAIDARWRAGPWKVAKLLDGPFTHIGDRPARVAAT